MLTSLPPPPQVEDDDPRGAGGTEEVFEAEVDQVWQLARLLSFRFFLQCTVIVMQKFIFSGFCYRLLDLMPGCNENRVKHGVRV